MNRNVNRKSEIRIFRVVGNSADADGKFPYAIVDPEDTVVHIDASAWRAAEWAFGRYGDEIEVRHEEDLIAADARIFHREE